MGKAKRKMLVVDDVTINRVILTDLFEERYEVLEAENGKKALEIMLQHREELSVVLLDLMMPVMDGFEVLVAMDGEDLLDSIPVIMITGENDDEKALTGYSLGVSDLVEKPFNPDVVFKRVNNVVTLYEHKAEMERRLREQKEMLEEQAARIRLANQFLIDALSTTVEFRNMESGEHIIRVRSLTKILLLELRHSYPLTNEQIETISNVSAMHDIGKIAISDVILLKPGPLTKEEFEIMKTHTTQGCEILNNLGYDRGEEYYIYAYDICRHHHERWDGRGYPDGLCGDEISIWAQATSLADVYDALTSKRVYKSAIPHAEAVDMIMGGKCGAFNPKLLECFLNVQNTLQSQVEQAVSKAKAELEQRK